MKKFWKVLGLAAIAAAVPVRVKRDDATGKKTYQSLLLSFDVGPDEEGIGTEIGVNVGEGLLTNAIGGLVNAKKEAHLFTDDPEEAVLFADDEPEAAVVSPELTEVPAAEEPEAAAAETAEPEATEEDFDPEL